MLSPTNLNHISAVISVLRFPLIIGVVLIHNVIVQPSYAINQGLDFAAFFIEFFSHQLTAPCVPLFFFISGFLFFRNYHGTFSFSAYKSQLKKRIRTLLIPYILWNAIVIGYFAFMHRFTPSLINSDFNNVFHFSIIEFLRCFWDFPGGQPICFQFWFLRDLIIGTIITPILFCIIKYAKWLILLALTITFIINNTLFPKQVMLTFFSLGVGCAILNIDFVALSRKLAIIALPTFAISLIINTLQIGGGNGLIIISGSISFIAIASWCSSYEPRFAEATFFVYAFHGFPLLIISKSIIKILAPSSSIMLLTEYLLCFTLIILMSIFLHKILKKFLPKTTQILTGGR